MCHSTFYSAIFYVPMPAIGRFDVPEISRKVILGVGIESLTGNSERRVALDTAAVSYRD